MNISAWVEVKMEMEMSMRYCEPHSGNGIGLESKSECGDVWDGNISQSKGKAKAIEIE